MVVGLLWALACGAGMVEQAEGALARHELAAAERGFRAAIGQDERNVEALAGLGWTYLVAGESEAAKAAFGRCVELEPREVGCVRGMASAALATGDPARARELVERARSFAPEAHEVEGSLALLELHMGENEAAGARFARLVKRQPEQQEYRLGLAEARLRGGRPEDGLAAVDAAWDHPVTGVRQRAMLLQMQARALLATVAGRVDPADCAGTLPPVRAWLGAVEGTMALGAETDVVLPGRGALERMLTRRRGAIEDICPGS